MSDTRYDNDNDPGFDAAEAGYGYDPGYEMDYDAAELGEELAALRPPGAEGRTSWAYIGLLGALFFLLIGFSWACSDRGSDAVAPGTSSEDGESVPEIEPTSLIIAVDGDIVTIRGSVPDESAREQLVGATAQVYEESSLIDDITVDPNTTLEGGTIRVTGIAAEDDQRPAQVKDTIVAGFGLADGGTELQSPDTAKRPVDIGIQLTTESVVMLGQVPDEVSIGDLRDAAGALWNLELVDPQLLEATDLTTWEEGRIRLTGALPPGDDRHLQLVDELTDRIGALVEVDTSGVEVDSSAESVEAVETEIREALAAEPILFAPQSAAIDAVSDEILTAIAEKLQTLPAVRVEVVGHTDDLGPDDENLVLSVQRAEAVVARLTELGVDAQRLSARGEGENVPLVDEDTAAARDQNRRIEFNLIGP